MFLLEGTLAYLISSNESKKSVGFLPGEGSASWHKWLFCALLVCFLCFGGSGNSLLSPASCLATEFYYFNPDTSQGNLGNLKREFDQYLLEKGFSANFQPFAHFVDFHRRNNERRPSFILVPDWYYRKYGKELGLRPILKPMRNGSTSYQKVILVPKSASAAPNDYEIISFALTSMLQEDVNEELKVLLANQLIDKQQVNMITVPKDLDAILALVLGQVQMALVAEYNLQTIAEINPKILHNVKQLDDTITVPMPVLCYLENRVDDKQVVKLLEIFTGMSKEKPQNKILEMLKIDNWKKISY